MRRGRTKTAGTKKAKPQLRHVAGDLITAAEARAMKRRFEEAVIKKALYPFPRESLQAMFEAKSIKAVREILRAEFDKRIAVLNDMMAKLRAGQEVGNG